MRRPLVALRDVPRVSYSDAFLIEDLLTSNITYVTGEPKAGKSLLVAGMLIALTDDSPDFLGLRVIRKVDSIIYGYTDEGADSELRERLAGTAAHERVTVAEMFAAGDEDWRELTEHLIETKPDLFVLDTVVGSLPTDRDIANGTTAGWLAGKLRPIAAAGIAVIAVTHSPKGGAEGLTTASSVMGGRAMAGGARGVVALLRSEKTGRSVNAMINRARRDVKLRVSVESAGPQSETPVWSVRGSAETSPEVRASPKDEFLAWVAETKPTAPSKSALASLYGAAPISTVTRWITDELYQTPADEWRPRSEVREKAA